MKKPARPKKIKWHYLAVLFAGGFFVFNLIFYLIILWWAGGS